jgi:predicted RNA binding protein YcfA (HicA-like mRNA interferase family)
MGRCEKLEQQARQNPKGVRFKDACALAECRGFTLRRTSGSHRIYTHPDEERPLPLQPDKNGMAKTYQVKQLLELIDRRQP